jgi:hypothetical protein
MRDGAGLIAATQSGAPLPSGRGSVGADARHWPLTSSPQSPLSKPFHKARDAFLNGNFGLVA